MKILVGITVILTAAFINKTISYHDLDKHNESLEAELQKVYRQIDTTETTHQEMLQKQKEFSLVEGCYQTIRILCDKYLAENSIKCRNDLNQACQEIQY
jgi:hypothetical protein